MAEQIPFGGVLDRILMRLGSSNVQKIGSMFGVLNELRKLKEKLAIFKAVLLDAEEKREKSSAVEAWVLRVNRVVRFADGLLADFAERFADGLLADFATHQTQREGAARQVRHLFSPFNFRFQMLNIIMTVDKVVEEIRREENKEEIIKSMVSSNNQEKLSMVAIVGDGGLGKTTLARLVYNDEKVAQYFEPRIWVCVSDHFDVNVKWLIKKILGSINIQNMEGFEWDDLKDRLWEELSQKKYLLVLDDVCDEYFEKWDQLKALLMVGAKGSKIVVTTQSHAAESVMQSAFTINLQPLERDESM